MSGPSPTPRPAPEEADWLELVLRDDAEAARRRAQLSRDPRVRERLAELERFVAHCRTLAREQERRAAAAGGDALIARVLARTTRRDLGWSGDLRLAGRFVRERLRASLALRVAAASLVLHLFALPVVAWMVWVRPEPSEPRIGVEPPPPPAPFDASTGRDQAPPEVVSPVLGTDAELAALDRHAVDRVLFVENSLRLARWSLVEGPSLRAEDLPVRGPVADLLRLRLEALAGEEVPAARAPAPGADPLSRALLLELVLDRWLLAGELPGGFEELCAAVAADADLERPGGLLAAAALGRAASYGVLPLELRAAVAALCARAGERRELRALVGCEGDARDILPLDERWSRVLVAAVPRGAHRRALARFLGVDVPR